jgi:multiple sugar transport system permease protein
VATTQIKQRGLYSREWVVALAFLLPNICGFFLFTAGPVLASLVLSFTSWDLLTPPRFVGFSNFVELLGFRNTVDGWRANDPNFWKYLYNTLFMMMSLPVNIATSLFLAVILIKKIRFTYFYRLIFFLPTILAGVAIFYLWRWIYNPEYGLFNTMLGVVGIQGPTWLTDPFWAKPAIMIMGMWIGIGGTGMILYIAALQNVPIELYEAAEIDGANAWRQFWAVTWPSVMPVTFFLFTMGIISGLQYGAEAVMIMTQGGPFGATTTLGYFIYTKAYVDFEMGYAATIAWVLFALTLSITILNWKKGGKNLAD